MKFRHLYEPSDGQGGGCHHPNRFFQFFSEMGRAFPQTKFLPVGSSLGHLSMKKFFRSDLPSWLYKIRQKEGVGGGNHPLPPIEQKLTYLFNHEDDIQS